MTSSLTGSPRWPAELSRVSAVDLQALVPGLLAFGLFGAWTAVDGGFPTTWWLPGGILLLGACLVSLLAGAVDLARLHASQRLALGAFAALTAWSFLSLLWAEVSGDAWDGANRTLVYLLVIFLFSTLPWRPATAAIVLGVYVAVVAGVGLAWFAHIASAVDARDFMGGRLANPTGYQNANAALFMMAFWPAVVVGSRRGAPLVVRAPALAVATFLAQLAFLCESRGAFFTMPVVALAMLALLPGRLRTVFALALPLAGVAAIREPLLDVYAAGESQRRLADALPPAAGAMLASAAVVGVVGLVWAVVDRRVLVPHRVGRAVGVGCLAVATVVAAIAVPRLDPIDRVERGWSQFTHPESVPAKGTSYLAYGLSGNRYDLWKVGVNQFRDRPLLGQGADNFAVAYLRERRYDEQPHFPHSLEIRMLGGLGAIGAGLALVFVVATLAVVLRIRGATAIERAVVTAALLPFLWWLVHGSVDWLWEFPALSGPALALSALAGAVLPAHARARAGRRLKRGLIPVMVGVAAAAVLATLVPPWLAARHVTAAQAAWRVDPDAAYRSLRSARTLNPFSDEPDVVTGAIAARLRDDDRARAAFARALERNPTNRYAAHELGLLESVAGRKASALRYLDRARALNPLEGMLPVLAARVRDGERIHPSSLDLLFLREARSLVT